MRYIKFRALNKSTGEVYPAEDELCISSTGKGAMMYDYIYGDHDYLEELELLQYTGMKDKNGVEIYEDDNLKIVLECEIYTSPVMNRHGCWVIYHPYRLDVNTGNRDYINFGWWTSHDNVEVIGNIHEPETQT